MASLIVDINSEQEKRILLAFLNSLNYNYHTDESVIDLSEEQQAEILKRDQDFTNGKIKSFLWEDISKNYK